MSAPHHLTDLTFVADSTSQRFHFEHVFQDNSDQKTIFEASVAPLIPLLFDGYNLCVVAYGQAGSGKTYSLAGPPSELHLVSPDLSLILK